MSQAETWIICGSRRIRSSRTVDGILDEAWAARPVGTPQPRVIVGGAGGVDTIAERWARRHGIEPDVMRADWNRYGKRAGYVRNVAMLEEGGPDALVIAIWDGQSRGTGHTIDLAKRRAMQVTVMYV
jgi:hypothetical protein